MSLTESIKHAPRWTWYAVGGVGIGAGAIHLWKNRQTSSGTTPLASDPNADPTTIGSPSTVGTGSSPPGFIVPPVIAPAAPVDQSGTGLGDLQALFMGGAAQIIDTFAKDVPAAYAGVYQNTNDQNAVLIDALAGAGSAPHPAVTAPSPIVVNVTPPPPAAAQTPTTQPKPTDPCPGSEYPYQGPDGCYKVVCASGKGDHAKGRWHYYRSGKQIHVAGAC